MDNGLVCFSCRNGPGRRVCLNDPSSSETHQYNQCYLLFVPDTRRVLYGCLSPSYPYVGKKTGLGFVTGLPPPSTTSESQPAEDDNPPEEPQPADDNDHPEERAPAGDPVLADVKAAVASITSKDSTVLPALCCVAKHFGAEKAYRKIFIQYKSRLLLAKGMEVDKAALREHWRQR